MTAEYETIKGFCPGCQAPGIQKESMKELVVLEIGEHKTSRCIDCIIKNFTEFHTSKASVYAKIIEDAIKEASDNKDSSGAVHQAVGRILETHGVVLHHRSQEK